MPEYGSRQLRLDTQRLVRQGCGVAQDPYSFYDDVLHPAPLTGARAVKDRERKPVFGESRSSGYLLLDMALALTILLLLVAIIWPIFGRGTTTTFQSATALDIATLLREDRLAAVRTGRSATTFINLDQRTLTGASGRRIEVAKDMALEVTTGEACMTNARRFTIVFSPEGKSCGGVIVLRKRDITYAVRFNWLSGMIDVVHAYKRG